MQQTHTYKMHVFFVVYFVFVCHLFAFSGVMLSVRHHKGNWPVKVLWWLKMLWKTCPLGCPW